MICLVKRVVCGFKMSLKGLLWGCKGEISSKLQLLARILQVGDFQCNMFCGVQSDKSLEGEVHMNL